MPTSKVSYGNLEVEIVETGDEVVYWFRGDVDENFKQIELPRVQRPVIILELEQINNFNSCGIREWIYLAKALSALGQLHLRHCSVIMIDQINMVPDLLGNGEIESFFAPYYCETDGCVGEVSKLIDLAEYQETMAKSLAPELLCDRCQKPLSFDALEESYFLFVEETLKNVS